MLLTDYIAENCIIPELKATTKADALRELTSILIDRKKIKDGAAALDQIMAREATESTGIGHGIAVPHARVPGLKSLACSVGRAVNGLDFFSVDKKPVHVIFLICYPPTQQTTYLTFIATVARLLRDPKYLQAFLAAKDEKDVHALLEKLSSRMVEQEEQGAQKVEVTPELRKASDNHADLVLLARLQLCQEMYETARTGKRQIKQRIENIRGMVDSRLLKHYDRLMASRPPALVPVEGDTCQGCFMKLPSQYAQKVRQEADHVHTCNNCARFIYIV